MNYPNEEKSTFFAFLSHKSADTKFALKLQKFIESYNLPTEIRKKANIHHKRLTPVCSYEIDFSSNPLVDEMLDKLKKSKYLILICSEELIKQGTKYINHEIKTFIECKKEEGINPLTRIIPVIVTGEFGSPDHECCPEALKELGDNCPIALDRRKYKNDRELFLHVISGMLGIDYAILNNRDKKRQRKKKALASISLAAIMTVGILLGEYYIPRKYHYLDFVMKNGLPEGINSLSFKEYSNLESHYIITKQKHKIQSLEYVNSLGNRIDHDKNVLVGDRPSAYIFEYSSSGISSVTYENRAGVPYFIMQYSSGTLNSVDLKDPYDPTEIYILGSGYESNPSKLLADYNISAHSNISGFKYTRSEEGYVTKVQFCADNTGRLAPDNAVYGFEYVLDKKGRIIETYFLDAMGERRLNSEGIYSRKFIYDENDDLIEWTNHGTNGTLTADSAGIVRKVNTFDKYHNVIETTFYDENGNPKYIASYRAVTQKLHYENGNLVLGKLFDENGKYCKNSDYVAVAFTYDKNGFMESQTYLNENGEATLIHAVNYAIHKYINNDLGKPVENLFYDTEGNLINNVDGYAREVIEYDSNGRMLKSSYYDKDGSPADFSEYGYSTKTVTYDERGRETSESYWGKDGTPVNITGPIFAYGYHKLETVYEYGPMTKMTQTFYNAENEIVNVLTSSEGETYAKSIIYIQNGEITYTVNYRSDGSIYENIMETKTEYNSKAEPITTSVYTNEEGKLLQKNIIYYTINGAEAKKEFYSYDASENVTESSKLVFDENGKYKEYETTLYSEDGSVSETYLSQYDNNENIISEVSTDFSDMENHIYKTDYVYDIAGNKIEEKTTGLNVNGVTQSSFNIKFRTDGTKQMMESVSYIDGIINSVYTYNYNNNGDVVLLEISMYDYNGQIMDSYRFSYNYNSDGSYTKITDILDENGNSIYSFENTYDTNGNPID